jgi:UDP-N-acetylglucosamine acyltransferase
VIHPQAIVDPEAKIGEGVEVGAFSIIGPDVEIGDGTWVGPHVVINGPTRIGRENRIYQFVSLGEAPQHSGYHGEPTRLVIGDRNLIREYVTMNRGTVAGRGETIVGDDNFLMAYTHIAHDCQVGDKTIFANGSSLAGHVEIGDQAILGGFTLVHQFCRVGAHCITAVGTAVFKDIPPFVVAAGADGARPFGLNLRGLKRRGFTPEAIDALRRAYKIMYRSGLGLQEALAELEPLAGEHSEVQQFTDFAANSERGIIRG